MHILDWVESSDFISSLEGLIAPSGARVLPGGVWMPQGRLNPAEALLTKPCEPLLSQELSVRLRKWWIAVDRNDPNEPNWDLAVQAEFPNGQRGLILAEAKAHTGELKQEEKGKNPRGNQKNHTRIGEAIEEAREALGGESAGVRISHESHYQFSNRIAFAWKLASEGVPCVLIYLGCTEDTTIATDYLRDDEHWLDTVRAHVRPVFPETWIDRELSAGESSFWFLVRSRRCARSSPARGIGGGNERALFPK
jgi:hypothetical protein